MIAIVVVLAFVALVVLMQGRGERRAARMPTDPLPTAIGALREGAVVYVCGTVAIGATLRAPVSGKPCVFYDVTVRGTRALGIAETTREQRAVRFVVDDGTGQIAVDATAARGDALAGRISVQPAMVTVLGSVLARDFLLRHHLVHGAHPAGAPVAFAPDLSLHEVILAPGDHVAITGTVARVGDALVLVGTDAQPLELGVDPSAVT